MIRDVIQNVQLAFAQVAPPGISAVTPSAGATGTVLLDGSSSALGSFQGLLQVLTTGALGAATAQLSLDGGKNYGPAFTIPLVPAQPLPVPLDPSPVLSGLALNFSGSFTAGDSYSFSVEAAPTFLLGAEHLDSQDSLFPRVIWVPTEDDFEGTEDYAGTGSQFSPARDQRTQARAIQTAVARFETHCWGIDAQRTERLRDQCINAIRFALQGVTRLHKGEWLNGKGKINQAGRAYIFSWTVKKPVLQITADTTVVQPPFTLVATPEVDT